MTSAVGNPRCSRPRSPGWRFNGWQQVKAVGVIYEQSSHVELPERVIAKVEEDRQGGYLLIDGNENE